MSRQEHDEGDSEVTGSSSGPKQSSPSLSTPRRDSGLLGGLQPALISGRAIRAGLQVSEKHDRTASLSAATFPGGAGTDRGPGEPWPQGEDVVSHFLRFW